MNLNPQIDATLSELTRQCCSALESNGKIDRNRIEQLVTNLSTNGWERHSKDAPPLRTILRDRVQSEAREDVLNRGGQLDAIVATIQRMYEEARPMHANTPDA